MSKMYFTQFNNDIMSEGGNTVIDAFASFHFTEAGEGRCLCQKPH